MAVPLWQSCLFSAFRTALACIIVGCITLYGPASVQRLIALPAFSYVTVILIMANDATLGDTLRGCWLALYATIQSIGPAMLSLWFIGPSRFSKETTALAVALAAFVVVLPAESTHLIAKRIALGEIVLVYVTAYINGVQTEPLLHPLRAAASTALGILACVLALLFPYPRLACRQVKHDYKLLTNNTLERLKLLAKAICEEDRTCALASVSRAQSLASQRDKLLQNITRYQESVRWERPLIKVFGPHYPSPGEKLEVLHKSLRGMEVALRSIDSFPVSIVDGDLKNGLNRLEEHLRLAIKHRSQCMSLTVPEPTAKSVTNFLQSLHTVPSTRQDLPIYFFLFCAQLLYQEPLLESPTSIKDSSGFDKGLLSCWFTKLRSPMLIQAFKCSLALGLSILLGLNYSKKMGFWAGLPVAISFASGREATFLVANLKAQGTVLGSVYGVLGCFLFERVMAIRFLSLLPWFVFTSFLQRSRMYGPAGGISAVIGAVLILGRKNFGTPIDFAIERIVETFIGLFCSILVDLAFFPKRASTCAKIELSQSLGTLHKSILSLSIVPAGKTHLEGLKMQINQLKKFIAEAEMEPNFWYLPFRSGSYNKISESLSKMMDLLHIASRALNFLEQEFQRNEASWKDVLTVLEHDLGKLKEITCSSIKNFELVIKMKSLRFLEKELEKNNISYDIESGKSPKSTVCMVSSLSEDEIEKTIASYLQHSTNAVDNIYALEGEQELRNQVVLSLSALGFCLSAFIKEAIEIEEAIKELVQGENPSSEINLYEISFLYEVRLLNSNQKRRLPLVFTRISLTLQICFYSDLGITFSVRNRRVIRAC
ncbi:hypothetical protein L6164_019190 [Bauhinia variegata]|uniref:Uncharacterized protein n=1 Tax=Bauhinia variegata TaxID=167791 RepID=A0ACB9NEC1_BAUVA|nr:hypothetical protein L6164_019190 [Bauhinia variegata]